MNPYKNGRVAFRQETNDCVNMDAVAEERIPKKILTKMKRAKVEKPAHIPSVEWNAPAKLNHRHKTIACLAAAGIAIKDIAEQVGMSASTISSLLPTDQMKNEIARVRAEMFIKEPQKRFMQILPEAIDTAYDIMKDQGAKEGERADIAFKFMDRALGKPKETHEVKTSSIRDLFQKLEEMHRGKIIDVTPIKEQDELDVWVEDNFPNEPSSPG